MSMVYKEGKVTVTQGSTKLVGIGTKFLNPIFNIFTGQIIQIRTGDRVLINTIDEVVSDTEIKLAFDSPESATEVDYVILMTTVDSISDAANKIVAMTKHSVVLAELMVDWFTLSGEIEITLPDGSKVTVMSITEIQNQLSQKATKDNIKGFYKLYKSKKEADDDLVNRVDGDQVLIWSDDKSTYGFYKVVDGSYELVESERKVSTINNVKPDDTGNVQITLPGGNPSLWLGEVTWFPYDQGGVGYSGLLPADGQEHKRADYPDTWAAIENGLIASVSEDKWQAGENLVFSTGNGTTTFRVPNLMQGQALSAAKKGDKGSKVLEQVPYIKMINGKSPDSSGNITIEGEIEKRVEAYGDNNLVNWKGSHYMAGLVGAKSDTINIALDASTSNPAIAANGGGGGWRYFGLPATGGTIATQQWMQGYILHPGGNSYITDVTAYASNSLVRVNGGTGEVGFYNITADDWMAYHNRTDFIINGSSLRMNGKNDWPGFTLYRADKTHLRAEANPVSSTTFFNMVDRDASGVNVYSASIPREYGGITLASRQWVLTDAIYKHSLLPFNAPVGIPNNDNNKLARQTHYDYRNLSYDQTRNFQSYPIGVSCGISTHNKVWGGSNNSVMGMATFRGWTDASGNLANMQLLTQSGHLYWRNGNIGLDTMGNAWTIWSESNTTTDGNGFIKRSSPIVKLNPDGTSTLNNESEGVRTSQVGVGVYRIEGVLGYNSDGLWGVNGGISIPKDVNGNELVFVKDIVNKDGSITLMTYHRKGSHLPVMFQNNRLKETLKDGTKIYYEDGEPCDLPESTYLDVRVQMPEDSIYNLKQKEGLKTSSPIIFDKGEN